MSGLSANVGSFEHPGTVFVPDKDWLRRYASVIVRFAANIQPGDIVGVTTQPEIRDLFHYVVAESYRAGAKYVDPNNRDLQTDYLRAKYSQNEEDLSFEMRWAKNRVLQLSADRAANIVLLGNAPYTGDIDAYAERLGRIVSPGRNAFGKVIDKKTISWTNVAAPNEKWAQAVYPDLPPSEAHEQLWRDIAYVCRLDSADPVQAWNERLDQLDAMAGNLTARNFTALRVEGPGPDGTNFTIGLLPTSTWATARWHTVDGRPHVVNLPTEEVFTAPDPQAADGIVKSTKPLLLSGIPVTDMVVKFENGQAVQVHASSGEEVIRQHIQKDEGARRLGEIALVDASGRIDELQTTFLTTLLDENAASHLAFGSAYESTVSAEDVDKVNHSSIHTDFMFGSPDLRVYGVTQDSQEVLVMQDGNWTI